MTVPVTLSQTIQSTKIFTLAVTAAASLVTNSATAVVAIRPAAADVLSVSVSPGTVNAGSPIAVSAQVFNTANAARSLIAHVDLLDASNNLIKAISDTPVALEPGAGPMTITLPSVDSTGLGVGAYNLRVILEAPDGGPIPGHTAEAPFLVGISVMASVAASTPIVAPGTSNVTTTISVAGDNNVAPPPPQTAPFGDILAFYSVPNNYGVSDTADGAVFVIENTSNQDITGGVFTITPPSGQAPPDSFKVGTAPRRRTRRHPARHLGRRRHEPYHLRGHGYPPRRERPGSRRPQHAARVHRRLRRVHHRFGYLHLRRHAAAFGR
jgi:hypothetical protein